MTGTVERMMEEYLSEAVMLRHDLHRFPELGHQEFRTTEKIRDILEKHGVEILEYSLKTGVVARIRGAHKGIRIALREDIDALPIQEETDLPFQSKIPGISHACGHDIHAAILLLTGLVLNKIKNEVRGEVILIFQPAEELCDGAAEMLAAGVLKNHCADQLLGLHCSPSIQLGKVGIKEGSNNASCDLVHIEIKGKGGHGAHPEECVDPIIAASFLLIQMQQLISRETNPLESAVLTFGQIEAGTAPNIIPDRVLLHGTLRTLRAETRQKLMEAITRMVNGACISMRTDCSLSFDKGMPPLVNHPDIAGRFFKAVMQSLGSDAAVRLTEPSMGSDDFSCLLSECGNYGGQFLIGTGDEEIPATQSGLHNSHTIFSDEAIYYGARVLIQYILNEGETAQTMEKQGGGNSQ